MKIVVFILAVVGVGMICACGGEVKDLRTYRWEKRVILSCLEDEAWLAQEKRKDELKGKVGDRDLVIFRVKAGGELGVKYGLKEGEHVLIGKDGGVKGRQKGVLNFEKWFVLIDGMPMRKREMGGQD